MTILEYYMSQQDHQWWVDKFQSTGKDKCGKLFSCLNVNFRNLTSFFNQLEAFKPKDGLRREDWNSYQENGQEKDKHRVVNLKNAGLIKVVGDRYYVTDKGNEVLRISANEDLSDREKWVLLLMLILDYNTEDRQFDLVRSVVELDCALKKQGLETVDFLVMLKNALQITSKETLFSMDVFWLISFAKDDKFARIYLDSSKDERKRLHEYVIACAKNKKSKDLIAHKFVSGGAYSVSTFNDDMNMIFSILILLSLHDKDWDNYVGIVSKCYVKCTPENIKNFMAENIAVYQAAYQNSFGRINALLKQGGSL